MNLKAGWLYSWWELVFQFLWITWMDDICDEIVPEQQKAVSNFPIPCLNKTWNSGIFRFLWCFCFTSYRDWTFYITPFMTQFPLMCFRICFAVFIVYFLSYNFKLGTAVHCNNQNLFCWPHLSSITWCLHFQVLFTSVQYYKLN